MKQIEAIYLPQRRLCRGCRKPRSARSFPESEVETLCKRCGRRVVDQMLDAINVRPSDARRR